MNNDREPEHKQSEHDHRENEMDVFSSYLWKNRELLGEPTQARVYNFPYHSINSLKSLPDKILVHMQENPKGMMIVIQVPSKKFYYVMADEYGK